MDQSEAHALAQATHDLMQHYPVRWLDDKAVAWMNFSQTVAMVYGTRIMAIRMRKSMSRPAPQAPAAPVSPVQNAPPPPAPAVQTPNGLQMNGVATEPAMPRREVPRDARVGEIPGVGNVEFPPDHPLAGGSRKMN